MVRAALAGVLVWSAGAKLVRGGEAREAFATFGLASPAARTAAWAAVSAAELALAAGILAGLDAAAYAAAGLMLVFAAVLAAAIISGRAGRPCACFGARTRVGWPGALRNLALAGAFAAIPSLSEISLGTDAWLAIGLALALSLCCALAVAVLALFREVGMLRMQLGPQSALEVPEEGPELGGRTALIERFESKPGAELALAVFVSEGCGACQKLEPAIASLARDPVLRVSTFEEAHDADAWREADAPGSPFAVAIDLDGTVLAKGTFNNLAQLESVLATAERRRAAGARSGAPAAPMTPEAVGD